MAPCLSKHAILLCVAAPVLRGPAAAWHNYSSAAGVGLSAAACMAQPECFGTMAPEAPGSETLRCNMCGGARTEAEFLAEMEQL